ncbi:conserved hypothetical protein [Brochothrix thermosphacta]|uniref:flavin reductase family protein n=1 Tax=Brochothrix thermosphacta TaxID=2756 RepID=UPI000D0E9510|nr:flavin reductase family protein [Brochothrix thermosphacta]SOC27737.1 conserved hypothetical protein [Brochothrix thermosphacta]
MITIRPESISERDNYKFLIESVIPRPIAFITSINSEGVVNGAPFSYFNIVSSNPPLLSVSIQRRNGEKKDTLRNIEQQQSFVLHIADDGYIDKLNQTAAQLPPNQSEIALTNLTLIPSETIATPAISEAKVRYECTVQQIVDLPNSELIIANITCYHIDDELYANGRINAAKLNPISRLAGNDYAHLGETFTLERPQ